MVAKEEVRFLCELCCSGEKQGLLVVEWAYAGETPAFSFFGVHLVSIALKSLYGKVQEKGSNPLYSI